MNYVVGIILEILRFLKEKGYIAELLDWADKQVDNTESPIDDAAIKILKFFLG